MIHWTNLLSMVEHVYVLNAATAILEETLDSGRLHTCDHKAVNISTGLRVSAKGMKNNEKGKTCAQNTCS